MTRILDETFEGGTNTSTVSTSTSAFSSVVTGATITHDNAVPLFGSLVMKCGYASNTAYGVKTLTAATTMYVRFYVWLDTNPTAGYQIAGVLSGATNRCQLAISTTGKLLIRNGNTLATTSSQTVTGSKWVRIEWDIVATLQTVRIYFGANLNTSTPTETLTGAAGGSSFDSFRIGVIASPGNTGIARFDQVAVDDTAQPGQYVPDGTLSGSGALSATGSPAATGSATLSGSGTLAATAQIQAAGSASLSGAGSLSASGTPAATGSASLSGSGSLSASGVATGGEAHSGTASLSGSGTLAASGTPRLSTTASMSGAGTLTASGTPTVVSAAILSGDGALTAIGVPSLSDVVALSGDGTLTAAAVPTLVGAAILSGLGILTAIGVKRYTPQPTPPERTVGFALPDRSGSWTLDDRTTSLTLPSRTTSTTLGA